ncbi:MAG: protein-S-isoprenylcysteine O-methyltransferase [Bacteroidota bacterium]
MDTRLIFEIVFIVFMVVMGIIRRPFEKAVKDNSIDVQKKDTEEKILLGLTFLGMSIIPLVYILSPWLNFANYQLPLYLQLMGVVVMVLAAVFFYRSHKDLGKNWSVSLEIREEHTLITSGIYKSIRHPMYTAIWLWVIGQALLLPNYIAGLSGIVGFGLLYLIRVGKEEKMMEAQFGDQYLHYKKQTKRLIPGIL